MNKDYVLGAGLAERLRPLTDQLPKPLIPVFHRPLITYAFDHLLSVGVGEFIINTHHLPQAYNTAFPEAEYQGAPLRFREESPVRLETAGGIANVQDLLGSDPFLVYNGDILTDLPLQSLMETHNSSGNLVTLALRSQGPALHIALDEATGLVTDIRNLLGTGQEGSYLFTGIYACSPEIHRWLTPGKVQSVIPVFLRMIQEGARLGGVILDEGHWWDLGSRTSYLEAHRTLTQLGSEFPSYGKSSDRVAVAESALLGSQTELAGLNVIGDGASVGAGAYLENCILWPGAKVEPGSRLHECIVRQGVTAGGSATGRDF